MGGCGVGYVPTHHSILAVRALRRYLDATRGMQSSEQMLAATGAAPPKSPPWYTRMWGALKAEWAERKGETFYRADGLSGDADACEICGYELRRHIGRRCVTEVALNDDDD